MTDKTSKDPLTDFEAPKAKAAVEIDADAPILSEAEIEQIKLQARQDILKERKSEARKHLLAVETQRLKNEEGLITGNGYQDEMVNITIDLALFSPAIIINSRPYWHGKTYSVPRHVADTLRETMYRTWGHQADIDGQSKTAFYANKRVADLFKVDNRGKPLVAGAALSAKSA